MDSQGTDPLMIKKKKKSSKMDFKVLHSCVNRLKVTCLYTLNG